MRSMVELVNIVDMLGGVTLHAGPDPDMPGAWGVVCTLGHLRIIAASGFAWDHVSVSCEGRVPDYQEMKNVKRLFFKADEWAMELHAPEVRHINVHPYVLHLWRPQDGSIPIPPEILV